MQRLELLGSNRKPQPDLEARMPEKLAEEGPMNESPRDEMKANAAAAKIQAGFRGYRVRKQLKESKKPTDQDLGSQKSESPRSLKRQDTRTSLEEKSATKIQAGIRGFLVRKRQQNAQAAATRIQAGFRGFLTRKLLKQNGQ
ncbi:abnormal spindle-like microcephaly-associated protein homolog isoform X2 [Orussus abietinus]|uniref:abnormal spindle-like microcephaly-associated protein homolog isoform X2 n=1 Tax=Orussus abietinus TaxID=222816 RepID=UPI0006268F7A|nr:abnormal spindle-like microcephaly-associated protein homolog isoform X2 [Orussus abietinus]